MALLQLSLREIGKESSVGLTLLDIFVYFFAFIGAIVFLFLSIAFVIRFMMRWSYKRRFGNDQRN